MSLISADQTFQLTAVLLLLTAFGFWVERTRIGRKLSGVLIILFLGLLLSNIGLIPHSAPIYSGVSSMLVPLAIPMLLFRADLKKVVNEIGPMLKAFIASALVISFTVIVFCLAFDFGEFEAKVGGTLAASYIGGSLNFVAVAQAVELTDPNHYVAALTADTIGAVWFLVLIMMLPTLAIARRAMPSRYITTGDEDHETVEDEDHGAVEQEEDEAEEEAGTFNIIGLSAAIAASMTICALGQLIAAGLGMDNYFILIITVLSLAVANFAQPLVRRFNAEFEVATFFMYIFFITIGASAELSSMAGVALPYVGLICGAVLLFIVLIIPLGKLLKLDLAELMIAANACILGPPTAAAMAAGEGWNDLVTPGMLTGVLGYSVATFIGVAITQILA